MPIEVPTPMETAPRESLTLAKALAVKNRLAGRLAQARSNVETYNSILEGQKASALDVRAEFDRLVRLQEAIVVVKAAIQAANLPIYEDVLRLAEKKGLVQMFQNLNTKQGPEPGYNGVEYRYEATILKPEALEQIRKLEAEIDAIQDHLTAYNAATRIEIAPAILDLAR